MFVRCSLLLTLFLSQAAVINYTAAGWYVTCSNYRNNFEISKATAIQIWYLQLASLSCLLCSFVSNRIIWCERMRWTLGPTDWNWWAFGRRIIKAFPTYFCLPHTRTRTDGDSKAGWRGHARWDTTSCVFVCRASSFYRVYYVFTTYLFSCVSCDPLP